MSKYIVSRMGLKISGEIVEIDEKYEPIENKVDSPYILCECNGESYLLPSFYFTKCSGNERIDKIAIDFLKESR